MPVKVVGNRVVEAKTGKKFSKAKKGGYKSAAEAKRHARAVNANLKK